MTDYNLAKDKDIPPPDKLNPGDRLILDESVTWEQLWEEADRAEAAAKEEGKNGDADTSP